MKLKTKITGGFGLLIVLSAALGCAGYWAAQENKRSIRKLSQDLPMVTALHQIKFGASQVSSAQRAFLRFNLPEDARNRELDTAQKGLQASQSGFAKYALIAMTADQVTIWKALQPIWKAWQDANDEFFRFEGKVHDLGVGDPLSFKMRVEAFVNDHYLLRANTLDYLLNDAPLSGGDDPSECPLGIWLEDQNLSNPQLLESARAAMEPHRKVHAAVREILALHQVEGGVQKGRVVFVEKMRPALKALHVQLEKMSKLAGDACALAGQAQQQATEVCQAKKLSAFELLEDLVKSTENDAASTAGGARANAELAKVISIAVPLTAVVVGVILAVVVTVSITSAMRETLAVANQIAKGDLTRFVTQVKNDEMGELGKVINHVSANLRSMLSEVKTAVQRLGGSANRLSTISSEMAKGVDGTSSRAQTVAEAAQKMSSNAITVAKGMEAATANLTSVAKANEQITASMTEISLKSEHAKVITDHAKLQAGRVSALTRQLSDAVKGIGRVSDTINAISEQTKLLALNATIEAAHAGAAGRGFAVVAHEIRDLASQTSTATEEIKTQVGAIQSSTQTTLDDLGSITEVIVQVSDMVTGIAVAICEQSSITQGISANVTQAVAGVRNANESVAEISDVSQAAAHDIGSVNTIAASIAKGSHQVLTNASDLSVIARELEETVSCFSIHHEDAALSSENESAGSLDSPHSQQRGPFRSRRRPPASRQESLLES